MLKIFFVSVAGCMASKFRNAGQVCIASNRVFVQSGIHDKFVAKLKETVEKTMVLGDGMDQGVNQVRGHSLRTNAA